MVKKTKSKSVEQADWPADDLEAIVDQADIDELVETVHNAREFRSRFARRRDARRRIDDIAFERTLKDELFDWYEDFGGDDSSGGQDDY